MMSSDLEIAATGPLATVQDRGRVGYQHIGVGSSGAADRGAYRLANRLVGNQPGAAAIETTFGGLVAHARRTLFVAVTGAHCPLSLDGRAAATNSTLLLRTGAQLRLGTPTAGVRSYVAVRGGIDVAPVLGSRATDTLSGLGPTRLRAGTLLPVGHAHGSMPAIDCAPLPPPPAENVSLRVVPGPREDWFSEAARANLFDGFYTVTPRSDRVGMRLEGPPLTRRRTAELPSEGMVAGAIQVPPSEQPTLFLSDHPVTGGYPVIAT